MKKLLTLICIAFSVGTKAQITISGYISDSASGERIIGANVYSPELRSGTTTNNYGFYSIALKKHEATNLVISIIGYVPYKMLCKPTKDTIINIKLSYSINVLKEVIITASPSQYKRAEMSKLELPMKQLAFMPKLAGETDIMRVFQLMPGVQMGKEGTSGIYVRGGTPDQNLILLDDIPLYYVNHIGGFISIFNSEAINAATLYKGGFPARYGGRLSSIVDVRMKEGNMKEFKGNFTFGILSSKLTLEIPIKKDKTSAIISLRRSLFDVLTRSYFLLINKPSTGRQNAGYTIYDLNVKINHKVSEKDHLYFSVYSGHDRLFATQHEASTYSIQEFKYNSERSTQWGNTVFAFRWNHLYNQKLFGNLTLGYTRFYYNNITKAEKNEASTNTNVGKMQSGFKSNVNDLLLKTDYDFIVNNKHNMKFGGALIYHTFKPSLNFNKFVEADSVYYDTIVKDDAIKALEAYLYVEDLYKITDDLTLNIGIRLSSFIVEKKFYFSPEPRLTINYAASNFTSLKASYSRMMQPLHLLSNSGAGLPADLWVPATPKASPEKSQQIALGVIHKLSEAKDIDLSIEAFYKTMNNLIDFREGISLFSGKTGWENKIETGGKGRVYGIEFYIEKKTGNTTGWISYTLSKNTRQFTNINNGKIYPYVYDHPHDLSIVMNHHFNKRITVSATWVFSSGNAITLPDTKSLIKEISHQLYGFENSGNFYSWSHIYPGKNNYRIPAYHRLDLSASFTRHLGKRTKVWSIDIYNAYNRLNPYYLYFKQSKSGEIKLYAFCLFPIIPSFSYSYSF